MLDDASRTSRKSLSAASSPRVAIAPMFQTTRRPVSRLVVTTNSRRPRRMFGGDFRKQLCRHPVFDQTLERPEIEQAVARDPVLEDIRRSDGGEVLVHLLVVARPEEGERSNQGADADAGHHGEFGPGARLGPAGEHAGAVGAVRPAAGDRQPRSGRGRQKAGETGRRIAPHARVRNARNDRGIFLLRREGGALRLLLLRVLGCRRSPLDLLPCFRQLLRMRRRPFGRRERRRDRAQQEPGGNKQKLYEACAKWLSDVDAQHSYSVSRLPMFAAPSLLPARLSGLHGSRCPASARHQP